MSPVSAGTLKGMDRHELFRLLDEDGDGVLTRRELGAGAGRLGWHWPEAPVYAALDNLLICEPLDEASFCVRVEEILTDPMGPYGRVLMSSPANRSPSAPARSRSALLVIDPQRSFTEGLWMGSMGRSGAREVEPLRQAFSSCAKRLSELSTDTEVMFTRCPFPPDSYGWDERVAEVIPDDQLYFVKPGNSALWPPTNGYRRWVEGLPARGCSTLLIGGCTLNSCVRVTAMETQALFPPDVLQVVVDLSLCGARASNYGPSPLFAGLSAVQSAIRQMESAGVTTREG